MTDRKAYMRGWAIEAVRQGQSPAEAVKEAARAWRAREAAERAVNAAMDDDAAEALSPDGA